jgi:putative membrane protein insertion efficiency factor
MKKIKTFLKTNFENTTIIDKTIIIFSFPIFLIGFGFYFLLEKLFWCVKQFFKLFAMGGIYFYKLVISPLLPKTCGFQPSCSTYCLECLKKHGLFKGGWLGVKRLARCNGGKKAWGYDPVPKTKKELEEEKDTSCHSINDKSIQLEKEPSTINNDEKLNNEEDFAEIK